MSVTDITIPVGDQTFPAYLARPLPAESAWPGVIVIHEVFGLNADIKDKANEIARHGYLTVAPDLYQGKSWPGCVRKAFTQLRAGSGQAFEVLDAARQLVADRPDCSGKVGVIGFCLGGGFALLCAPRPGFAVASVNYGDVPADAEKALAGSCPIVGSFGARDIGGTKAPERLQRALVVLEVEHDVHVYPESGHRFMSQSSGFGGVMAKIMRMDYNARDAADSWRRIFSFFDAELRGGSELAGGGDEGVG